MSRGHLTLIVKTTNSSYGEHCANSYLVTAQELLDSVTLNVNCEK